MARRPFSQMALVLICLACLGCPERHPGVVERMGEDGIPERVETGAEDEPGITNAELAKRMNGYRSTRARTAESARQPTSASGRLYAATPMASSASDFDPYETRGCPPEGSASTEKYQRYNRLKNRMRRPLMSEIDPSVSLEAMREPGFDRDRWYTGLAATIDGYVVSIKSTGKETCNCKAGQRSLKDLHIDLVSGPDDDSLPVIAEITPVMRLVWENEGWDDLEPAEIIDQLEGKNVRITGWLFYDRHHESGAENMDPGDQGGESPNWRATCWEIHPVTEFEVLD